MRRRRVPNKMPNLLVEFSVFLNTLRQKGHLVYEYNPFHNFLTNVDLYIIDDKYIVPAELAINSKNGELLVLKYTRIDYNYEYKWVDKRGIIIPDELVILAEEGTLWATAGSLIDFDTDLLNFDIDHPVEIEILPSYDGSVNLIINDNKNIPRLINSRFSVREKNAYEIVDRIGENDTNVYNSKTFDKDTSLYFLYEHNPHVSYQGFVKGLLLVGLYCFYFTYCDSDENESDFVAETGLIPAFMGNDGDPMSMDGGIKNQSSHKGIRLRLENLDKSYNYLKVYYVRYFADYLQNRVYECKKIYLKYPINSGILYIQITGYEEAEDLDPNLLNISRFNPKNILTLALCKNMLFFGNIIKNSDNYKELTDLALRIVPQLYRVDNFDHLDNLYFSESGDFAYYNSLNIYSKTGYFNQEYYRFGVVFIYLNGTLSNVYNTLGGVLSDDLELSLTGNLYSKTNEIILQRNYIKVDDFGWVKNDGEYDENESYKKKYDLKGLYINARGVCKFNCETNYYDNTIFAIQFKVPEEVSKFLKEELGIRGLFFVRQKCVPNIIAQCYVLPMDDVLEAPILEELNLPYNRDPEEELEEENVPEKMYYSERFLDNERQLTEEYSERLYEYSDEITKSSISNRRFAGICPDFLLNLPYYNLIFNGGKFKMLEISYLYSELVKRSRFYEERLNTEYRINKASKNVVINSVTEENPIIAIKNKIFRTEIGKTEEAYRFRFVGQKVEESNEIALATNLVRGKYSPYLAIYCEDGELKTNCLYNIYLDINTSIKQEFQNRMDSSEPFYSISDRYNVTCADVEYVCWRGDCYINQFTYRLNRNFNDPSLPNNDEIILHDTWDYFVNNPEDLEEWRKISRSDVNAVPLGSWITFRVRSAMNYALRSVDHSYVSEEALMGSPRSFYPRSFLLEKGENKIPDSYLYNDAYRASLGFKCYFTLKDINYIKDTFSNRILYSAIAVLDSYKNNYRYSLSTYYRDYSLEYGSIQKLIGFEGYLLVVFEHGIGIAVVNERILAGGGDGEPVFVNTHNVLPEELTVISDTYGTQWGDSVIKSEAGYVYGVDTIAKKIWRVKGLQLELLSDFKVNKFLIDNISLSEMELYPTIGLKNVKSHYNNNKKDIIFTFYDDIYKDEEKVWSLCYNELLGLFITFYSWIPSFSENIDTKFFTFDRNTAKELSLLAKCNYAIPENSGVLIDIPVINNDFSNLPTVHYVTLDKTQIIEYTIFDPVTGTTTLKLFSHEGEDLGNGQYEFVGIKFKLETDHWGNYKLFTFDNENRLTLNISEEELRQVFYELKVILLYITPYLSSISLIFADTNSSTLFKTEMIALTLNSIVENPLLTMKDKEIPGLTTDFYLHGLAGIFNVTENLYPTHWYGEFHPFEFEIIVNDKIGQLKIFEDLVIISNKAEPESFHFEIEGDNYEFSSDKRTMYFRQEATKELYLNLGSNILFNRYYTDVAANNYTYELYYRTKRELKLLLDEDNFKRAYNYNGRDINDKYIGVDKLYPVYSHGLVKQVKSTIFPLYYERIDTFNDIYHKYHLMHDEDGVYDFLNLSGSEISWNRDLNQFNIITHVKNRPIDHVGRLRGNSRYKEGKWNVLIPSIIFMLKNEIWGEPVVIKNKWFTLCESLLCDDDVLCGDDEIGEEIGEEVIILDDMSPLPPIVINSQYIPKDIATGLVSPDRLPNIYSKYGYNVGGVQVDGWTLRKEARIRDKWIKIRIRYSGKNLAVIHSLITLYNISYS